MKKLIAAILSLLMLLSAFAGVAEEWVDITEFVESGEETTGEEISGEETTGEETTEKETSGEETTEKETTGEETTEKETYGEETTEKETIEKETTEKEASGEETTEKETTGEETTGEETTGVETTGEETTEKEAYVFAVLNEAGEAIPYEITVDGETVALTATVGEDGCLKIMLPRAMAEEWLAAGKTEFVYTNGSYKVTLDIARLAGITYEAASLSVDTAPEISFEENRRTSGMLSAARILFCGIVKGEEMDISWNMAGTITYTCPAGNSCPGLRQITRKHAEGMNRTKIAFTLDIKQSEFILVTETLSSVLYIVIPETTDNLTLSADFATSGKCTVGDTIGGTVTLRELRNGFFSVKVYVNGILVDILRDRVDHKLPFSMKVTEDNVEDGYMKITLLFFDGTLESSRNAVLDLSYRVTEKQKDR